MARLEVTTQTSDVSKNQGNTHTLGRLTLGMKSVHVPWRSYRRRIDAITSLLRALLSAQWSLIGDASEQELRPIASAEMSLI